MTNTRLALWQGSECRGYLTGSIEHTGLGIRFSTTASSLAVGPAEIRSREVIFPITVRSLHEENALFQVVAGCEHSQVLLGSTGAGLG